MLRNIVCTTCLPYCENHTKVITYCGIGQIGWCRVSERMSSRDLATFFFYKFCLNPHTLTLNIKAPVSSLFCGKISMGDICKCKQHPCTLHNSIFHKL